MSPIKVLIIDDSAVVRQVLTATLGQDPAIEVIGAAADPVFAMDITVGPLVNLWGFGPDKQPVKTPDAGQIAQAKAKTPRPASAASARWRPRSKRP